MKDNTLRTEIWLLCDHQVSLHKQADDLTNAILSAILARLPKEEMMAMDVQSLQEGLAEIRGYNTCLAEVHKALDIESES